jgi:hypothetical protein
MRLMTTCLLLGLLLAGCRAAPPPATPTAVAQPLSPTPIATPTPMPTATATPAPTNTPTATASATAAPPTATPTATLMPDHTATAVMIPDLLGPDNFPPNVNPLTGERVRNPELLARRPLALKISNYPPFVRPQAGLNNADLVFEHYAEAGVTRFTAVFYGRDAALVGSIRSARLIDLEIPVMYDAALAYSGASGPIRLLIRDSSFFERVISPDFAHGGYYRRPVEGLPLEHTLFTDTATLRYILSERGEERPPQLANGMTFRAEPWQMGTPANQLEIGYQGTNLLWQYNPGDGRYYRWTEGTPHLDANDGRQLQFENIIVLGAHHQETDIIEDAGGNLSLQIQIWGEGPVSIFRNGQRFEGRWRRAVAGQMLTFYDLDGLPLPLAPGRSFFQIVPIGFTGLR